MVELGEVFFGIKFFIRVEKNGQLFGFYDVVFFWVFFYKKGIFIIQFFSYNKDECFEFYQKFYK